MTIMQIVMFRMYSVASLVGPRLEETVLATLLRKIRVVNRLNKLV